MDLERKAIPTSKPSSGLLLVKSLALLYLCFITNQIELEIHRSVVSQLLKWLNIICDRNIYISDKLRIKELDFPFFPSHLHDSNQCYAVAKTNPTHL